MKKMFLGLMLAFGLSGVAMAAGSGFPLDKAPARTNDMAALQNGAKLFVNYCLSCHSASFMRYNRLRDIGLTDKQIAENLTFTVTMQNLHTGEMLPLTRTAQKTAEGWRLAEVPFLAVLTGEGLSKIW